MPSPPVASWALALLLAALASALVAGAFWGLPPSAMVFTLPVAIGHALLLGLPAAIYCQHRRWTHVFAAIAGGFLVGATPMGLYAVGWYVFKGAVTGSTLLSSLRAAGIGGLLGAPGGLAFWLTLRAFGQFR
jgi:hypothetical protein